MSIFSLLFIRKEIVLFAHVITSVNSLYLLYAPVVTMVTNVSSHVLALCMVKSVIWSVCVVLIVNAHRSMDHVTAIQDILEQPAVQVCNVQSIQLFIL